MYPDCTILIICQLVSAVSMVPLKSIGVLLQHKWKSCYPQQSGCYLNVSHYIITGMGSFTIWLQPKTPSGFDDYASLMNECKREYSAESQQKLQESILFS